MLIATLLESSDSVMHQRFVINALEEFSSLVALFKTSSHNVSTGGQFTGQESTRKRAICNILDTIAAQEGQERPLVRTAESVVLALIVAWFDVVVLRTDGKVGSNLFEAEV